MESVDPDLCTSWRHCATFALGVVNEELLFILVQGFFSYVQKPSIWSLKLPTALFKPYCFEKMVLLTGPKGLFCCYCLRSTNPRYKHTSYIGFTNNPKHRIRQHNREIHGGARRTKLRGPWKMVLFTGGFPTKISALKFEFIWTYPNRSSYADRFVNFEAKKALTNPSTIDGTIETLLLLLSNNPYKSQPLFVTFLDEEYYNKYITKFRDALPQNFEIQMYSPEDMHIEPGVEVNAEDVYCLQQGQERVNRSSLASSLCSSRQTTCPICCNALPPANMRCVQCDSRFCITCLAQLFLQTAHSTDPGTQSSLLIPHGGMCPICKISLLWADLLRFRTKELVSERFVTRGTVDNGTDSIVLDTHADACDDPAATYMEPATKKGVSARPASLDGDDGQKYGTEASLRQSPQRYVPGSPITSELLYLDLNIRTGPPSRSASAEPSEGCSSPDSFQSSQPDDAQATARKNNGSPRRRSADFPFSISDDMGLSDSLDRSASHIIASVRRRNVHRMLMAEDCLSCSPRAARAGASAVVCVSSPESRSLYRGSPLSEPQLPLQVSALNIDSSDADPSGPSDPLEASACISLSE